MEFVAFAQSLALEAGEIMQAERSGSLRIQIKPDRTLVTTVDLAINELVIDAVVKNFPSYSVVGEEISYGSSDAEYIVHVDPLDGTGEYVDGSPEHVASYGFGLALQRGSRLESGLFFNPTKNEMFIALRGLGAYLNGEPIKVNTATPAYGIPYAYSYWDDAEPDLRKLEVEYGPPIDNYSAIYQGCMVALGRSAFSVFPGEKAHDIAPAAIIVSEAGGRATDLNGKGHDFRNDLHGAIFSNVVSHRAVLNLLCI